MGLDFGQLNVQMWCAGVSNQQINIESNQHPRRFKSTILKRSLPTDQW
jgi:hypothetical protein